MQVSKLLDKIDTIQQHRPSLSFIYALIKKYGDDRGGYQAALITYYGFLSLFPLLLVLVTLVQIVFGPNSSVRQHIITSVGHYFPLLSSQLQNNVHAKSGEGIGLAIGLLLTFYGARGGVNALSYTLNNIWHVPQDKRGNFLTNLWHGIAIMFVGGIGFIVAAAVSGLSSSVNYSSLSKLLLNFMSVCIIAGVLTAVSRLAIMLPAKAQFRDLLYGNIACAVLLQILLTFGSLIMKRELQNLNSIYGTFAIVLGLLFWIYLLTQVFMYAAEANAVRYWHLWPRGLTPPLTAADRQAQKLYLRRESYVGDESVEVEFKNQTSEEK